jgi:YbbR domain-containing protein
MVGVLLDVVEDSDCTFDNEKSAGFTDEFIDALRSVDKNETEHGTDEGYSQFIEQAQISHIGSRVKMADLKANLDVSRLREITEQDSTGLTG